jgi:hypothetical protein
MASCCSISQMLGIAKEMNVTKLITNMIAFNPPSEVEYNIIRNNRENTISTSEIFSVKNILKVQFQLSNYTNTNISEIYPWLEEECYLINKSDSNNSNNLFKTKNIVLLHIKNKNAKNRDNMTIIFSHGNSCDLASCYYFLVDLATQLKVKT